MYSAVHACSTLVLFTFQVNQHFSCRNWSICWNIIYTYSQPNVPFVIQLHSGVIRYIVHNTVSQAIFYLALNPTHRNQQSYSGSRGVYYTFVEWASRIHQHPLVYQCVHSRHKADNVSLNFKTRGQGWWLIRTLASKNHSLITRTCAAAIVRSLCTSLQNLCVKNLTACCMYMKRRYVLHIIIFQSLVIVAVMHAYLVLLVYTWGFTTTSIQLSNVTFIPIRYYSDHVSWVLMTTKAPEDILGVSEVHK